MPTPTADKISKVGTAIQKSGAAPLIDNTVKYVDENGLIGMNISTQLTLPGPGGLTGQTAQVFDASGQPTSSIDLPDFFVRTTRTRVNLRDGQSVMIDGLIDKENSRNITQVPFLAKIPLPEHLLQKILSMPRKRGSRGSGDAAHRAHARCGFRPVSEAGSLGDHRHGA